MIFHIKMCCVIKKNCSLLAFAGFSQSSLWPLYPFRVTNTKIFPGFMQRYNLKHLALKIDKIIKNRDLSLPEFLTISTDFSKKSIKFTRFLSIFNGIDFYRLATPGKLYKEEIFPCACDSHLLKADRQFLWFRSRTLFRNTPMISK